jgi:type II secretion system protein N
MTSTTQAARLTPRSWVVSVVAYPFFFLMCFVVSLYVTFPMAVLKGRILDEMTKALNASKTPGPYGKPGRVTADDVQLWRLSGLRFTHLVIHPVTMDPDPASPVEVESLQVRLQLTGLIKKAFEFYFVARAYDGVLSGTVTLGGEKGQQLRAIKATADGIAWGKIAVIRDTLKVPVEGLLGGDVDLNLGKEPKDHQGTLTLRGESLALGPGDLSVPAFGSLTLPRVDLGKLSGEVKFADGKTTGPPLALNGKDLQGQVEVPLSLKSKIEQSSILNGVMTFKLADEFLKANPKFQTVFDLAPPLKNAKDEEGVFHFRLKGTLRNPDVRPDRSARMGGGVSPR